jgi:hypothetical protein
MADGQDNDPVQSQANDEQDNAKNPQLNQHGVGNGTSDAPHDPSGQRDQTGPDQPGATDLDTDGSGENESGTVPEQNP